MALSKFDEAWAILGLNHRQDVLEAIFRVSDLKSLKRFRLVCHLWNKEVLRILPEKSYIRTSRGSLFFLYSTLETCPTPQYFLTTLEIHFSDSGMNNILKEILEKYGHHLKHLRCAGDIRENSISVVERNRNGNNILDTSPDDRSHIRTNIQITSNMLTVWCPNLTSVRFSTSIRIPDCCPTIDLTNKSVKPIGGGNNGNGNGNLVSISRTSPPPPSALPLRLTSIELDGYMISSLRTYCLQLLHVSPYLTRLSITFGLKFAKGLPIWEPLPEVITFFTELKKKPEITRRLKEFCAIGLKVAQLTDVIADLEFSSDLLQGIGISGATNVSDPEFPKFVTFLEKLSTFQNLGKLTIFKCSCAYCEWRNWREKPRWRDIEQTIPVMRNVKHLEIATNGTHGIASLSLLNRFPSLDTLEFSLCRVGHENPDHHIDNAADYVDFDYFMAEWVYLRMTAKYGDLLKANCQSIKSLTIHHTLFRLESLKCIQEAFPNLRKLSISIRSGVTYCWEVYMESKLSLSSCLEVLAKLPRLEELYVMMPTGVIYPQQEVSRAIKILREFPELRRFNVALGPPGHSRRAPFRSRDASDSSVRDLFSDFVLNRETHLFRSLTITFRGICCCKVTQPDLADIRKVLSSYKQSYRFNWCCHRCARILARYGNKRYEYSPVVKFDNNNANSQPICESSHYSVDIDALSIV
ncbi:uncharacterized protein LOC110853483 [Folsomia candida]|uniref:uncharacterized protein LOC110853483 n=1 Tax=Folsomia candida TaxID=158441 RepID=UPI000B8F89B9|nr:uncharacterized protein LOC110853483 [Folsomia candida]